MMKCMNKFASVPKWTCSIMSAETDTYTFILAFDYFRYATYKHINLL